MSLIRAEDMIVGTPLPGWTGRFFHAENVTCAIWAIEPGATPLHEHHHPNEEVWNVVEGEIALSLCGVEHILKAGDALVVPKDAPHAARPLGHCRAVVVDWPVRRHLPGVG